MYGSRKVHKTRVENCPPFQPILLAFGISTNKTCEILSANFKTFDIKTVKDSFHFVEEIVDQQPDFFMGSLDVDSHTLRGYHLYLHK